MAASINIAVSIDKSLFDQVEVLAQQFNIAPEQLFAIAMEQYLQKNKGQAQIGGGRRRFNQGDIYWAPVPESDMTQSDYTHPQVVIQENVINRSRVNTVVVCALTSNIKRASAPGNVLLEVGEANLPRQSVVEVSKVAAVEKTQLGEYIGSLSRQRIQQILSGMQFLHTLAEAGQRDK